MRSRHRPTHAWLAGLMLAAAASVSLSGCGAPSDARQAERSAPDPNAVKAQACSERLHELSEQLLLYHAQQGLLPPDLAATYQGGEFKATCPGTQTLYLYNPAGWPTDREGENVILCDAAPVHMGRRLGLVVQPAEPGAPLVLKVASLDASFVPE